VGLHRGLTKLKNAGASGKKLAQLPKPASSLKNVLQVVFVLILNESFLKHQSAQRKCKFGYINNHLLKVHREKITTHNFFPTDHCANLCLRRWWLWSNNYQSASTSVNTIFFSSSSLA
jgi:hypothetical protein